MIAAVYFALALLLCLTTAGLARPRWFRGVPGGVTAILAMAAGLGLPHLILAGLALTVAIAPTGALAAPLGTLGLALHLACWGVLLAHGLQLGTSLPVLDGTEVADRAQPFGDSRPFQADWLPAFSLANDRSGVSISARQIWREIDGVRLRVDIYRPLAGEGHPCLLYLHGGGWITGSPWQGRFHGPAFARLGFVVFAVTYRRAPRFPLPAALEDAEAALDWVYAHAAAHGGDPDWIAVMGGSAGGHLASLVALRAGTAPAVRAAILYYGVTSLQPMLHLDRRSALQLYLEQVAVRRPYAEVPDLYQRLDPLSYVRADAPPTLFIHGTHDRLVPIRASETLAAALRAAGAPQVHLLRVPFATHAFDQAPTPATQRAQRVAQAFLLSTWQQRESAPGPFPADGALS